MIKQIKIGLKGMAMGCADVVPGVSGGTIALLTGIYPRLITAITRFNPQALRLLLNGQINKLWKHVDGSFLLPLLIGIILAFGLLAKSIKYSITHHPVLTWSFFFGLIIASALLIIKNIENKKLKNSFWLLPGIVVGFGIASLTSLPFPEGNAAIFLAAMIAICAMILPGISGSFILLLLGMYEPVITAVDEKDFVVIGIFAAGAILGLMMFSRIIQWVLKHFYQLTLFFLSGLMLGSLVKIWPWKSADDVLQNVWPSAHPQPLLMTSIGLMLLSVILVFVIDFVGEKFQEKDASLD